jgi:acetyltransferase-like isoleucine patch superfamily enzyme
MPNACELQGTTMSLTVTGSGTLEVAPSARIATDAQLVFNSPGRVVIGDYCVIGPGVRIVCSGGDVSIGEWTTLHDRCLVLSKVGVRIGAHCWFGQQSVIDGTGGVTIGRGVRVGMYSQIWSHVAAGEQIEGCTLFGERSVIIEDDVWLVGTCIVSSGVTIGRRTVALIGSNITKSCDGGSVLAGSPAARKPGLSFYHEISLAEKWSKLLGWIEQIASEATLDVVHDASSSTSRLSRRGLESDGIVLFARDLSVATALRARQPGATVCCVEDKTYNRVLSRLEYDVLKALAGNKARFYAD